MTRALAAAVVAFWLIACCVAGAAYASPAEDPLGHTAQGKVVSAFLAALNADGAEALEQFVAANWSAAARPMSAAERATALRRVRGDAGVLTLRRLEKATEDEVVVLLAGSAGPFVRMAFALETAQPPRIRGVRVNLVDPEEATSPPLPALTLEQAVAEVRGAAAAATAADEFAGSVLVAHRGATLVREGYGMANREHGVPNRPDTRFNLGSINKLFTRIAIGRLAAAGKLSLDDRLGKWLPTYPNADARDRATIRHLIGMASGIGDFFGARFDATPKDRFRTNRDFLPMFAGDPLLFAPGSGQRYSNGGYIVLGEVVAAASGRDYYAYVADEIFARAGMTASASFEADAIVPNLAEGYTRGERGDGELRKNMYTRPARGSAAGGGYSTADDLLAFTRALLADSLLPAAWTEWVLGGPEPAAGAAGAGIAHTRGGIGVAGGAPGINAALELELESGDVVIVLANLDPPAATRLAARIRRILAAVAPAS